jgi:hypothetical protein
MRRLIVEEAMLFVKETIEKMKRRSFSERADGLAFWSMMLLGIAFLTYSYAMTHTVDWLLIFVPTIGILLVFRLAWTVYAWRKPSSIDVEKVERVAFWGISLTLLGVLTVEYVATSLFDFYVFYIFVAGLLIKAISKLTKR